ncbi:MAG: hypothetical protein LBE09_07715 [Christensenellaceae bacterium]|jgi:transposase-like protein|nr:hypothetical protein [Christensenellaceae bacterium]
MIEMMKELLLLLSKYSRDQIITALTLLKTMPDVKDDITVGEIHKCPYCNSENLVKNGVMTNKQRFLCKECHKSFSATRLTTRHGSHLTDATWRMAIEDTLNGVSLKKSAARIGVSALTIFRLRRKILDSIKQGRPFS